MAEVDESRECSRCYAIVRSPATLQEHNKWHARSEGIEMPSSEFGFWDPQGDRWTPTSRDW